MNLGRWVANAISSVGIRSGIPFLHLIIASRLNPHVLMFIALNEKKLERFIGDYEESDAVGW